MNFEEISRKLKKFSKDTMIEVQKMNEVRQLNARINDEKKKITRTYTEMGKKVYELYKDTPLGGFEADMEAIEECVRMMDLLQDQIREIKGVLLCPCCNMEVSRTERFCSNCGNKMPETIEIVNQADSVVEIEKDQADVVIESEADQKDQMDSVTESEADRNDQADAVIESEADRNDQADVVIESEADQKDQADAVIESEADRNDQADAVIESEADQKDQADVVIESEADRNDQEDAVIESEADRNDQEDAVIESEADRNDQADAVIESEADQKNQADTVLEAAEVTAASVIVTTEEEVTDALWEDC